MYNSQMPHCLTAGLSILVFDAFFLNFYKDLALFLYKIYAIYHIYSKLMANVTSTNPLLNLY